MTDDTPLIKSVADTLAAEDPMDVRDRLPTENEIRAALKLLQIPLYADQRDAIEAATGPGRITLLLSILSTWTGVYQLMHEREDRLDRDGMMQVIRAGVDGPAGHDPRAPLNLAGWWLNAAAFTLEDAGKNLNPALNPNEAIGGLLVAVIRLLEMWRNAHDTPGWTIGDKAYAVVDADVLRQAAQDAYDARIAIKRMIPKGDGGSSPSTR